MMKHLKRNLSLVLVFVFFVTLLAGCTKKPAAVIYFEKDASKEFFDKKIDDKSYYSDFIAKNTQPINS